MSILSDDLLQELGGDQTVAVLAPKKKKPSTKVTKDNEECEGNSEPLSKREMKRVEQLQTRKDKEVKRDFYLKSLSEHAVSAEHQQLFRSTRDIGRRSTKKDELKRALKRHKAGLTLNETEQDMLFPRKECTDPLALAGDAYLDGASHHDHTLLHEGSGVASSDTTIEQAKNALKLTGNTPELSPLAISDAAKALSSGGVIESSKNTIKHTETAPELLPLASSAAGNQQPKMSLLEQLKHLKDSINSKSASVSVSASTDLPDHLGLLTNTEEISSSAGSGTVYIPSPIADPVTMKGQVVGARNDTTCDDTSSSSSKRLLIESLGIRRDPEIQSARMNLPVCAMEQEIVEAINSNDVVILCGETGSGKSTQVPQFLLEAGYGEIGMIGITQPRRVAAVSTAERVAVELGQPILKGSKQQQQSNKKSKKVSSDAAAHAAHGHAAHGLVGYQIRLDSTTVGAETKVKFMTDGILLREVTSDLLLRKYSVVILDEAHERNINTDILLGLISRTLPLRRAQAAAEEARWKQLEESERHEYEEPLKPLKLVIMSATMRVEDFHNPILFPSPPPIIKVDARQYPVTVHFARRTELRHYLKEIHRKVCQIHRRLPDGGILVFLTGKREIQYMCRKVYRSLNGKNKGSKGATNTDTGAVLTTSTGEEVDLADESSSKANEDSGGGSGGLSLLDGMDADEEAADQWAAEQDDDGESFSDESDDGFDSDDEGNNDDSNVTADVSGGGDAKTQALRQKMLRAALGFETVLPSVEEQAQGLSGGQFGGDTNEEEEESANTCSRVLVLPLYAMMSAKQQNRVFQPPPAGHRLVVIATDVAETSITIPGIKYVIDCGRHKERVQDLSSGVSKFEVKWVAQASAEQRKGRAGRTGPGHCYRLFSSAFYDQHMAKFQSPAITKTPLDDLLLQMRALGITEIETFPFPTAPPAQSLKAALDVLVNLGAIAKSRSNITSIEDFAGITAAAMTASGSTSSLTLAQRHEKQMKELDKRKRLQAGGKLTKLGRLLAKFPINPRFAKMLIIGQKSNMLSLSLALVATLAERSPFDSIRGSKTDSANVPDDDDASSDSDDEAEQEATSAKAPLWFHSDSDALARLRALGAFSFAQSDHGKKHDKKKAKTKKEETDDPETAVKKLCAFQGLHQPTLQRCIDLRKQLARSCAAAFIEDDKSKLGSAVLASQPQSKKRHASSALDPNNNSVDAQKEAVNRFIEEIMREGIAPPSQTQEAALRQIILTGFCDSVARRAPLGTVKEGSRHRRLTAYISCNPAITEILYIHPHSALYKKDPTAKLPEYVAYGSLIKNQRGDVTYMNCVTVVNPAWLGALAGDCPLLRFSAPLTTPAPYYDSDGDCIVCYVVPKYGAHNWELTPVKKPLRDCLGADDDASSQEAGSLFQENNVPIGYRQRDLPYRWFARLLVEGAVLPELRKVFRKETLKETPSVITAAKPNERVAKLVRVLVAGEIQTKKSLLLKLKADSSFLSEELQQILAVDSRKEFRRIWKALSV